MHHISTLWKANTIAFISSFCVMVIELIASRILAPHIGVSLYTWTSIIGVILAGIALGNYVGGKIADRRPSPLVLAAIFLAGSLATIAILPATNIVTSANWFGNLPVMWNFILKTSFIFFLPAIILSMVSPMVIKLTLADLGRTGGVVGTIYAFSTAGAILGTFMTGFYFILWFGTRTIVWLVAAVLFLMGITAWFSWRVPGRWRLSLKNFVIWTAIIEIALTAAFLFQSGKPRPETYAARMIMRRESNYYTITVYQGDKNVRVLALDHLVHSYTNPDDPTVLVYAYLKVFEEMVGYLARENPAPRILYLGGGGYTFPRYMETVYPGSINEVVEIDPVVTEVAHQELGLPLATSIKTYNQDARLFLIQRQTGDRYNIVIGDVFNDRSTPYHLTTLEFDRLIKANMEDDGIYLVNIVDDYERGRYLPSFIHTLGQAFQYVYFFGAGRSPDEVGSGTFAIAASDRRIDLTSYRQFVTEDRGGNITGYPYTETELENYLAARYPILLTDDYAPTDILVALLFQ
ncbi:MAG: fused MFS/spermidine synthase [Chloroflexi bacterium]|nr:fused MFS/spermidine synthase [Chloroflexota bacterium]MBI3930600.1 fused MFS/spermidine synthase [Chloroflexota bacterium]